MYSEILSRVRSKKEAEILSEEIDRLWQSLYKTRGETFDELLKTSIRAWVADTLRSEFAKEGVDKQKLLKNLKQGLRNLTTFKLTLGFEPSEGAISKFHDWVKANLGEGVILDIDYNPKLLAGAIVTYQGKYADFSLRKKLEREFADKKQEIVKMLTV